MTTEKLTSELEFQYVLCSVESRVWTGAVTDSVTSAEVTAEKKADPDAGKFVKVLIKSSALAKVRNAANKARVALYGSSVPWLAGCHLVKIERMGDVDKAIEDQRAIFNEAVSEFLEDYPALVKGAAARLGALFDASEYPTTEALKGKFSLSVTWLPFTKVSPEILKALDAQTANMIQKSVESAIERSKQEAHEEAVSRAIDIVGGVETALSRYTDAERAGEKAVLHKSRIESLSNAAANIRDYTFPATESDAEKIKAMAEEIETIAADGPEAMKESEKFRADTAAKLAAMRGKLESMRGWC